MFERFGARCFGMCLATFSGLFGMLSGKVFICEEKACKEPRRTFTNTHQPIETNKQAQFSFGVETWLTAQMGHIRGPYDRAMRGCLGPLAIEGCIGLYRALGCTGS